MPVSKRLRYEILRRDNHTCRYCGRAAPAVALTVDHVLPVTLGGTDVAENLVASCAECNAGKSSVPPDAVVLAQVCDDHIRWARAIAQAAAVMDEQLAEKTELHRKIDTIWCEHFVGYGGIPWDRPENWPEGIDGFRARGLSRTAIIDALWKTHGASHVNQWDRWRYFAGICWRRITELEEAARSLIAVEEADS